MQARCSGATSPYDIVVMAIADEMQQELIHSESTAYTSLR